VASLPLLFWAVRRVWGPLAGLATATSMTVLPVEEITDCYGNRCGRIVAPAGSLRLWNDTLVEDSGEPDPVHPDAPQHAVEDLPAEVLTTSMRAHQKYFALLDGAGKLASRFLLVANNATSDEGAAVVAGNERVLRARLSDARFFWDLDRQQRLDSRVPKLAERIFQRAYA